MRLEHIYETISFRNEKIYKVADPMLFNYETNFEEFKKLCAKVGFEKLATTN